MTPNHPARPSPGEGPEVRRELPVVLLHGQPGSAQDWRRVTALLPDCALLTPQRPGYDGSAPGGFVHNARWLLDLLDRHGIARAVVAGYSWSGGAALTAAHLAPDRIAAVTLINSVGTREAYSLLDRLLAGQIGGRLFIWLMRRFGPALTTQLIGSTGSRLHAESVAAFHRDLVAMAHGPAWPSWWVEQKALLAETPLLESQLTGIEVPVTVLSATRDAMVPPAAGRRLAHLLPCAGLREVDAGHLLLLENPEAVAAAIRHTLTLVRA